MSTTTTTPEIEETQGYRMPPGLRYPLYAYAAKPWVRMGEPIKLFEYLEANFGSIATYRFMGTNIVYISDPEYVREILVNQAGAFIKERTLQRMKILLGEGLITSDDPIHMRQRKLMAPAFHRQRIAGYASEIVANTAALADSWRDGQTIDANATMMKLSLRIIAQTLFNTPVTPEILAINDEVNTIMGLYNFLVVFPRLEDVLHLPIPGVVKFRRSRARLNRTVDRMIAERRIALARGDASQGDLLTMLVQTRLEATDGAPEEAMSDRQVRDEVLTIFLAGYETVANALSWTWYMLSQNPAAEARLHAELDAVLGTGAERRDATLADYPALRYTEMVFAEAMRLYPPAWAMGRQSTRPVTLGPYRIPAGAHFFFSQYVMHRKPELFPDPLRFDPERHTAEAKAARSKFAYFPFGGGGRQCIGEAFAWMEGVLAIATLAQRWRLEFLPEYPVVPQAKITLRPKYPMSMRLAAR